MIQKTLDALSDPTRREILKLLKRGEKSAGEISERFDVSAPAISRHLSLLRDAEMVSARREGKNVYYSLSLDFIDEMKVWLNGFAE
ncbi:MAG: winged helix-turn-helix transcriptional regulator [Clostridia bacterium]|nr:winged helix-turn-helix transcriptional regulator [Clostridia bacterium]